MKLGKTIFPLGQGFSTSLTLGQDGSLLSESVLGLADCVAASHASIHEMPVAPTKKCLQILSHVSQLFP